MVELFPTEKFRKKFNQLIKYKEQYIRECEIIPETNPFDVSDLDGYYKRIEQWDTSQLQWKLGRCRAASLTKDTYDAWLLSNFKKNMPNNFLGYRDDTLDIYRKRCKIALKELKTAERMVLQGAYLPESQRRYGYQIKLDTGIRGFVEKDIEILKEGCEFILKDKVAEYVKERVCPIALDNALALHYEINRRNVQKGFYDMDIKSGKIVRDIERNCVNFPLVKDIPYIKNGREILKLRVQVNQEPDSSGRVGRIDVIKPLPYHPIFDKFIGKDAKFVWNTRLTLEEQKEISRLVYPGWSTILDVKTNYLSLHPDFSRLLHIISRKGKTFKEEGISYITVGSESCVWAQKTRPAVQVTKEAAKISEAEYKTKNPLELTEITERFMESLEQMEKGLIDAHPRQDLFDSAVSTFEAWVEYDFDPNVIEPMLANMLYHHIAKIDSRLVSKNLILLIEDQLERGYERWEWVGAWLHKFGTIKDSLSVNDWRYIIKITKQPITTFLDSHDLQILMDRMETVDSIKFKKEFLNIEGYYKELKDLYNDDGEFKKKWHAHMKTPLNKEYIFFLTMIKLKELQLNVNLAKKELEIQRKAWGERTPAEVWIDAFIEARDNKEISTQGREVGLARRSFVSESSGYLHVGVMDNLGNYWSGFFTSDPMEWFGGSSVREKWDEMSQEEQIEWSIKNTDAHIGTFNPLTYSKYVIRARLYGIFTDNFFWKELQCWDEDASEWDEECILDSVSQYLGEYEWSLR